jgi:hypothetical protein
MVGQGGVVLQPASWRPDDALAHAPLQRSGPEDWHPDMCSTREPSPPAMQACRAPMVLNARQQPAERAIDRMPASTQATEPASARLVGV